VLSQKHDCTRPVPPPYPLFRFDGVGMRVGDTPPPDPEALACKHANTFAQHRRVMGRTDSTDRECLAILLGTDKGREDMNAFKHESVQRRKRAEQIACKDAWRRLAHESVLAC
jgi:hypothetical protein